MFNILNAPITIFIRPKYTMVTYGRYVTFAHLCRVASYLRAFRGNAMGRNVEVRFSCRVKWSRNVTQWWWWNRREREKRRKKWKRQGKHVEETEEKKKETREQNADAQQVKLFWKKRNSDYESVPVRVLFCVVSRDGGEGMQNDFSAEIRATRI